MDIWHFDRVTGEFLAADKADANPLEEGGWLIPAYATDVAPPEPQEGKARVWFGGSWDFVPDHRGETWWKADAEFNDEPVTIVGPGDPTLSGLTNIEPPARPVVVPPIVVSARQIRQALSLLKMRVGVEAWMQIADQDTRDNWQFTPDFVRGENPVEVAVEALGKSPEEIDELFELAKTL